MACRMDPAACCRSHASWCKVQGVRAVAHWLGGWAGVDTDLKTGLNIDRTFYLLSFHIPLSFQPIMSAKATSKPKAPKASKPAPSKGAEKSAPAPAPEKAPVDANGILTLPNADSVDMGELLTNAQKWAGVKVQLQKEHGLVQAHDAFGDLHTSDGELFALSIDQQWLKACYEIVLKGVIKPYHKASDKRVKALKAKRAGK